MHVFLHVVQHHNFSASTLFGAPYNYLSQEAERMRKYEYACICVLMREKRAREVKRSFTGTGCGVGPGCLPAELRTPWPRGRHRSRALDTRAP